MTDIAQLTHIYGITFAVAAILCLGFAMIAKHFGDMKMISTFTMCFTIIVAFTIWISLA